MRKQVYPLVLFAIVAAATLGQIRGRGPSLPPMDTDAAIYGALLDTLIFQNEDSSVVSVVTYGNSNPPPYGRCRPSGSLSRLLRTRVAIRAVSQSTLPVDRNASEPAAWAAFRKTYPNSMGYYSVAQSG